MDKNLYDGNNWQGLSSIDTNSESRLKLLSINKWKLLVTVIQ